MNDEKQKTKKINDIVVAEMTVSSYIKIDCIVMLLIFLLNAKT